MSYDSIYKIASEGLRAEKMRLDVVAHNIAEQNTLLTTKESSAHPLHVVAQTKPFEAYLETNELFDSLRIEPLSLPMNKVYQPEHPLADKQGYLNYPGINTVDEMAALMRASRGYEANLRVISCAHSLHLQALTIGEDK